MKIGVKWIYQQVTAHGASLEAGQKPTLCFAGNKHMLCVAAGHPVRVLKRPLKDFEDCRDVYKGNSLYPVIDAAKKLAEIGARNGITNGAVKLIERALAKDVRDIDETEFQDEEHIVFTTKDQLAETEETKMASTSTKSKSTKSKSTKPKSTKSKSVKAKDGAAVVKGDGLGREGTVARFFNTRIMEGQMDDKTLVNEARKAFPDKKIADAYASWYRAALKKKGLLKA
jgi:hypothetical protein